MAVQKTEMECGCEILVYGDFSGRPEIVYCHVHEAAPDLKVALAALKKKVTTATVCLHCGESDAMNPDCLNLLATNKALAKAEGRFYEQDPARM